MQLDDEVGKVAQNTPIAICNPGFPIYVARALEIFLQQIINDAVAQLKKEDGTKLVTKTL